MSSLTTLPPVEESRRSAFMTRAFGDYQVARFNELYYQRRAASTRAWITRANVISALAASAVLASLLKDGFGLGQTLWQVLTGLAAISALVPVIGFEAKTTQFERAELGYGLVRARLRELLRDLKMAELDETFFAREREIAAIRDSLAALDAEPTKRRLSEQCWEQTLEEIPSENAWANL